MEQKTAGSKIHEGMFVLLFRWRALYNSITTLLYMNPLYEPPIVPYGRRSMADCGIIVARDDIASFIHEDDCLLYVTIKNTAMF